MAAIGQIRKHYGILVVIIGLALLAFVLGDLFKSTNRRQQNDVAVVNGEKITYQDFANLAEQNIENQKRNTGSISNDDAFNVRNQTLEQMIREIIMNEEFSALGITFGTEEDPKALNLSKIRYHKVIIMADADVDGAHISTLLLFAAFQL